MKTWSCGQLCVPLHRFLSNSYERKIFMDVDRHLDLRPFDSLLLG